MSEPVTPPVESTPAPIPTVGLSDLSETQRDHWLKTGDLPEVSNAPAEVSADVKATEAVDAPVVEAEPAPANAKTAKPAKPRDDINARLGQLAEQRRTEKERADKAEARIKELESAAGVTPTSTAAGKPVEPPVPAKPPTHLELVKKYQKEPDWPKLDDFASDPDFAADPYAAMAAAQAAYINEKQYAEIQRSHAQAQAAQRADQNMKAAWDEGKATYGDDWDLSSLDGLSGPGEPILSELTFASPLRATLLYHFSKHPVEVRALAAMEPFAAAHALGKLESRLSTPAPSRIATKTTSDAPEPPMTLGARHTPGAGVDEADEALKSGDFPRYRDVMNKRELAGVKR